YGVQLRSCAVAGGDDRRGRLSLRRDTSVLCPGAGRVCRSARCVGRGHDFRRSFSARPIIRLLSSNFTRTGETFCTLPRRTTATPALRAFVAGGNRAAFACNRHDSVKPLRGNGLPDQYRLAGCSAGEVVRAWLTRRVTLRRPDKGNPNLPDIAATRGTPN